jgi:hypothetical protein
MKCSGDEAAAGKWRRVVVTEEKRSRFFIVELISSRKNEKQLNK